MVFGERLNVYASNATHYECVCVLRRIDIERSLVTKPAVNGAYSPGPNVRDTK